MSAMEVGFGQILHNERMRLGLTQKELAEKAKVSRWTINQWELDRVHPSDLAKHRLFEVLGIEFPEKPHRFKIEVKSQKAQSFKVDLPKERTSKLPIGFKGELK